MSNQATATASSLDWGKALKLEVGDLTPKNDAHTERKPMPTIPEGKYAAVLAEALPRTTLTKNAYQTGAQGSTFKYVIVGGDFDGRKIGENLVVVKADGTYALVGQRIMKQRLMAFGLAPEKVNAFKGPKSQYELGDFASLPGKPVTIIIKADGEYEGRPRRRVVAVYTRNEE